MSYLDKLQKIQIELKAPKNQKNNFGNYMYRNQEDILEAVKPLLKLNKATLVLTDRVINVGNFNYIESTATFIDLEDAGEISVTALAREAIAQKGMNDAQLTGSSSSYARKYALNGLFLIDDTKDDDYNNTPKTEGKKPELTKAGYSKMIATINTGDWQTVDNALAMYTIDTESYDNLLNAINEAKQLKGE